MKIKYVLSVLITLFFITTAHATDLFITSEYFGKTATVDFNDETNSIIIPANTIVGITPLNIGIITSASTLITVPRGKYVIRIDDAKKTIAKKLKSREEKVVK